MFRNPGDAKIAEIFAESDLKGIGGNFYEKYSGAIKPNIDAMNKVLQKFYSTGNMIFPTSILDSEKIPIIEHNGQKYRVLDISNLPENADLSKYGLSVSDKKDLRVMFHYGDFETMQTLTKPFNEAVICSTMISPDKKATYCGQIIGMMLEAPNANVINSYSNNQGSGCGRDITAFVKMSFSNETQWFRKNNEYRTFQRDIFLKELSLKYDLTESDYADIYKQIVDKKFITRISDITLSNGTTIKSEDLKSAYKTVEEAIMKNTEIEHNEVNLYNPQVKGVILIGDSISKIPEEILQFVREHNLPIFIMGSRK